MSSQPESSTLEVLAGLVERVTFQNAENGFCVLRAKARGHRDLVTVVGHAATIAAAEWITASGEWVNDRVHGQQARRIEAVVLDGLPDNAPELALSRKLEEYGKLRWKRISKLPAHKAALAKLVFVGLQQLRR